MTAVIKKFIKGLQESSDSRKFRWLVLGSFFVGGMVVFLWSGYFSNILLIDTAPSGATGGVAVETEEVGGVGYVVDTIKNRVGLVADVVTSILGGPGTVPIPTQ
jgi:hypothetical protein